MAKLITKFKYLKPNARQSVGGYAKYIATREGVEKIDDSKMSGPVTERQKKIIRKILSDFPDSKETLEYEDYLSKPNFGNASEFISRAIENNSDEIEGSKTYADYIATRPRAEKIGTHGLFTNDDVHVNLSQVSKELNEYNGKLWTAIVSLRREDANRLGFDKGERWRDALRTQAVELSNQFHIPLENLKWYAAFHNEGHHPHAHMIIYSRNESEGYIDKNGIFNLRSSFAKAIFHQDLLSVYEKQTEQRDELRTDSKQLLSEIVASINRGMFDNIPLEEKIIRLSEELSNISGRKYYAYLRADIKNLVDSIVDDIAKDERISSLYGQWYEQREEIISIYTDDFPERIPLSKNEEFKVVRNIVINEAMNIANGNEDFIETDDEENTAETEQIKPQIVWQNKSSKTNDNRSSSVSATAVSRLLYQISHIIEEQIANDSQNYDGKIDKKLWQKINEKKEAHGLKQG